MESCLVDLVVKSMNESESVTVELLNARTVNNMPISTSCIVKTEDLARWPHLRDINILVIENGEVMLLIVLKENPSLFLPLECKSGDHDELIAIRYSDSDGSNGASEKRLQLFSELCPHKRKSVDSKGSPTQHRAI